MKHQLVKAVTASLAATAYPVAGYGSPFLRGNECVVVVAKDGDYAGGNITLETDNASDGSYTAFRAAADGDTATTQINEYYTVTLGDNIRITVAGVSAGGFQVLLLGDS